MPKNINEFSCCKCADTRSMTHKQIIEHLTEVHKIDVGTTKFTKQMQSHMDGDTWYSSTYLWTAPDGLQFTQNCWNERSKNDPMRF